MRSTTIRLSFLLAGVMALLLGTFAPARAAEGKIALVDFQRVLLESKRGQKAKTEWEGEVEKRNKALTKIKEEIESLQADFDKQGMLLTERMKEQKQEELSRKLKDAQRRAADYQDEIKQLDQKLTRDILAEARKLVENYAKEKGFDLILEATSIAPIYASPALDITDEIIKVFDSKK